jgi:hypothetical protein
MSRLSVMNIRAKKQKLLEYNYKFKQMMGTFDSYIIIFDYVDYICSDLYLAKLMLPVIANYEEEASSLENMSVEFNFDLSQPNTFEKIPIFQEVFEIWKNQINKNEMIDLRKGLPLFFALLSRAAFMIQEIKTLKDSGDVEGSLKIIEAIKHESVSVINLKDAKGFAEKNKTYGQIFDVCMEQINKYLLDEIDSDILLNRLPNNMPIYFNESDSILSIYEYEIKITRSNHFPVEHYILKAIFDNDNVYEKVSFYDISECEKDEYNNNWNRYRSACDRLNNKISKGTNYKINKFIEYTTGINGWCKISDIYK